MMKPLIVAIASIEYSMRYDYPFTIFSHQAIYQNSAFSDTVMMETQEDYIKETLGIYQLPPIIKTITIGVRHDGNNHFLMLSELGDIRVDKRLKWKLSEIMGIPKHAIKRHFHINDPSFDPVRNLGLAPGNVGPFPYFIRELEYILFLKNKTLCEFVAIRFTPFDTLIISEILFEMLMMAYLKWKGKEIIFIEIPDN